MPVPISKLKASEKKALLFDLNYLNLGEIKAFCRTKGIPYRIWIERPNGKRQKSSEDDRKGIILERIRHYLTTGEVLEATYFSARVMQDNPPKMTLTENDKLYYGQYQKNGSMNDVLKRLTDGKFKSGAVARILARSFWSRGIAPTYKEYANAWLSAKAEHMRPNPEWAFLSDRADGINTANWQQLRNEKARQVLAILYTL